MNSTVTKAIAAPHIRWAIARDMPEILAIEELSFPLPWSGDDFIRVLRQRNAICRVAEVNERVVGYAVYEIHRRYMAVLNFAVHPTYRRWKVGTALMNALKERISPTRQNRLELTVGERNLDAQLFLRTMGLRAVSMVDEPWEGWDEDGYLFEWRVI
jgi:ribosomal-protein-alanine N-acetyltransferase